MSNFIQSKILDYLSKGAVSNRKIVDRMVLLKKRYPNYARYEMYTPVEIMKVIQHLTELGVLNEARDIESKIRYLLEGRYGIRRIKTTLLRQGYPKKLIDEVSKNLSEEIAARSYDSIQRIIARKKLSLEKKYPDETEYKRNQRLLVFVISKGYDFEEAQRIIKF